MRLAVYYALIAVGYLGLAGASEHLASVSVPFVTVALLIPAIYAELLRVRGPHDDG